MAKSKKIFVLDTNVLLHDYKCIYNFGRNDVVIPITALEELDTFKKGNELINYMAREFTRELDKIAGKSLFTDGVPLGKGKGRLFVETGKDFSKEGKKSFPENIPDHRILAIAEWLHLNKEEPVILVSKDINLRMKAKALGVQSEDYETDKVIDLDKRIYKSIRIIEGIDSALIQKFYTAKKLPFALFAEYIKNPMPNEYFILKSSNTSALAYFNPFEELIERVEKKYMYGIQPRNAEQAFAAHALTNNSLPLVTLTGKAGTGKTLLALAAALDQRNKFNQILLARPIVPLSNKDIGYLPGDIKSKIGPYMQPLFDNLGVIKSQFTPASKDYQRIEEMLKEEKLIITPLSYIRGRSLSNVYFIVDEAQNLTPHEIKTIITRAGENSKFVFTGDIEQIDSPYLDSRSNGLSYLTDKMKGQEVFAHINLVKGERSYLAELASKLL